MNRFEASKEYLRGRLSYARLKQVEEKVDIEPPDTCRRCGSPALAPWPSLPNKPYGWRCLACYEVHSDSGEEGAA